MLLDWLIDLEMLRQAYTVTWKLRCMLCSELYFPCVDSLTEVLALPQTHDRL